MGSASGAEPPGCGLAWDALTQLSPSVGEGSGGGTGAGSLVM